MRRSAMIGLWLAATALATAAAFWAVNTAGSEVNDRPLTAVVATPAPTGDQTTILPPTTAVVATTDGSGVATSSPTSPTAPSPSPGAPAWETYTLNSAGGSVIVSFRPNEVRLESVAPAAGFTFEIDDQDSQRVEVEFEGDEVSYTLRAEWTSDGFTTRVDTSGGSG